MIPSLRIAVALFIWISSCLELASYGQGELGIIAGFSNYQGDLPSYNIQNGIKVKIGPVVGIHSAQELNKTFQVRADLLYTKLSGDDELAESTATRARNLDFFAPVIQLAVGVDYNVLGFSPKAGKVFTPFASVGASFFYFNPRTWYEGEKVSLQPLGTEGQYLEDYPDQKPYSRFQPTLQFGGGLKYLFSENLILSLEGMLSFTFTDYLDDASTIYITFPELLEKAGPLTAALANREGEYLGTGPSIQPTGVARANPDSRDLFGVMTLRVSMPIVIFSDEFKIRRHNNRTIPNPKF